MSLKTIIAGAVSGFVTAFVVDVHAWSETDDPYNWAKALKRWFAGAVTGASAATGLTLAGG